MTPDPARTIARAVEMIVQDGQITVSGRTVHRYVVGLAERQLIEATLRRHRGNQVATAIALGINRATLRKKIRLYAL